MRTKQMKRGVPFQPMVGSLTVDMSNTPGAVVPAPGEHLYLVGDSESQFRSHDFVFVSATSKEEAENKYLAYSALHDKLWLEGVYTRTINMSFAERFWIATNEEKKAFRTDHYSGDDGGDVLATQDDFKTRVRSFFGGRTDWADIFIDWFDGKTADDYQFPDAMMIYMRLNDDYSPVEAIRFDAIPRA